MFRDPVKVAGKTVGIERHGDPFLVQEPVVIRFPGYINIFQFFRAFDVTSGHDFHEADDLLAEVIAMTIEAMKQCIDDIKIGAQAGVKASEITLADFRVEAVQDFV